MALQHQLLVSDMMINIPHIHPLPVQMSRDGQDPTDCEQIFIVWNYTGKGDALGKDNYQGK